MRKIIITREAKGYKAYMNGDPKVWGHGETQEEAIGKLLHTWSERFGILLERRFD